MPAQPASIGRFEVRGRLGQGGMGVVYLALDPHIDRLVALKLLRVDDSNEMRDRFVREARTAGRLQHPNIVTVYDVGKHDEQPFIAMEYVAGETLAELIQRRAAMSLSRKLVLVEQLCDGLAYAHRAGLIHRDIKPNNLIVNRDGLLKILDFGIARMVDVSVTMTGVLLGTPSYMSPEQIEGTAIDHRSDIFSVGAVIYELLAYRQAFPGDSQHSIMEAVLHRTPPRLLQFDPDVDEDLMAIVDRALAKMPSARYQSLAEMREALAHVIRRLEAAHGDETNRTPSRPVSGSGATPTPKSARTPRLGAATPGPRGLSRAALAERRATQVAKHLDAARDAYQRGEVEAALEAAEQAAVLDPDDRRVIELLDQVRTTIENRQVQELLEAARERLEVGALTEAFRRLAEVAALRPADPDAAALEHDLVRAADDRAERRKRERAVAAALSHAREALDAGAFEAALRAAAEALAHDAGNPEAQAIHDRAADVLEERHAREKGDRAASEVVSRARAEFAGGDRQRALQHLRDAAPHERVQTALDELEREAVATAEREAREAVARARDDFDAGLHAQALEQLRGSAPHPLVQDALAELEAAVANIAEQQRREAAEAARRAEAERQRRLRAIAAQATAARLAMKEGDFEDAIETLEHALRREPDANELAGLLVEARARHATALREADIARLVDSAREACEGGQPEAALEVAAEAAVLDPADRRVIELLDQVRTTIENRQVQELLERARERLEAGALTDAFRRLADVRALRPADPEAATLEHDLVRAADDRAERSNREAAVAAALTRAGEALDAGAFEAAVKAAAEALAHDPGHAEARAIHERAAGGLEGRRAREEQDRGASEVAGRARADFDAGRHAQALEQLRRSAPHPLIQDALAELEAAEIAGRQRREAADAALRAEAERQRRLRAIAAQATAARLAMKEGDLEDAIETLEHALRREPDASELAALLVEARAGHATAVEHVVSSRNGQISGAPWQARRVSAAAVAMALAAAAAAVVVLRSCA